MAIWGLYHSDCLDGFGAAFALWLYYKKRYAHLPSPPSLSFMPVKYGEAFPAEPEPGDVIYILDFSFPREVLELHAQDKKIVVIDHHKTAAENLRRLPSSPIPLSPTGIVAHFDMNKSGAVMAWEYFFPDEPVPMLLQHIQDRDLWRFEIPGTRELTEALFYRPRTLPEWEKLLAPKAMEELRKEANGLEHHPCRAIHPGSKCHHRHFRDRRSALHPVPRGPIRRGLLHHRHRGNQIQPALTLSWCRCV
jgi:oligoribonuclease NrnB/cAMP/cGMP phosphodiesterase (DHH superfamily)